MKGTPQSPSSLLPWEGSGKAPSLGPGLLAPGAVRPECPWWCYGSWTHRGPGRSRFQSTVCVAIKQTGQGSSRRERVSQRHSHLQRPHRILGKGEPRGDCGPEGAAPPHGAPPSALRQGVAVGWLQLREHHAGWSPWPGTRRAGRVPCGGSRMKSGVLIISVNKTDGETWPGRTDGREQVRPALRPTAPRLLRPHPPSTL